MPSSREVVTIGARTTCDADVATFVRHLFAWGPLLTGAGERRQFIDWGKPISSVFDIDGIQEVASNNQGCARIPNAALKLISDSQNGVTPA